MKKMFAKLAGITALTVMLASCSQGGSTDKPADDATITVVASTSVWGDIAEAVAGGNPSVKVVSILDSADDDPHEYEATARDIATITSADIVVANGGGYDNWLSDHIQQGTPLITAVPVAQAHHHDHAAEHDHAAKGAQEATDEHDHATDNHESGEHAAAEHSSVFDNDPHVWMDLDIVNAFADALAEQLHKMNNDLPENAADALKEKTSALHQRADKLQSRNYILTEPIPSHLLEKTKMHDATPAGFAQSIANESEPAAADIAAAQSAIRAGTIDILITNQQSQSPASQELIRAAEESTTPVVNINETPDNSQDYFGYMETFLNALEKAAA